MRARLSRCENARRGVWVIEVVEWPRQTSLYRHVLQTPCVFMNDSIGVQLKTITGCFKHMYAFIRQVSFRERGDRFSYVRHKRTLQH